MQLAEFKAFCVTSYLTFYPLASVDVGVGLYNSMITMHSAVDFASTTKTLDSVVNETEAAINGENWPAERIYFLKIIQTYKLNNSSFL